MPLLPPPPCGATGKNAAILTDDAAPAPQVHRFWADINDDDSADDSGPCIFSSFRVPYVAAHAALDEAGICANSLVDPLIANHPWAAALDVRMGTSSTERIRANAPDDDVGNVAAAGGTTHHTASMEFIRANAPWRNTMWSRPPLIS